MRRSGLEKKFEEFVARYGLDYRRCDRVLPGCGRNRPDYEHIRRRNCVVELYHPIYHSFGEAVGKIAFYGARDYKTLVIWEAELNDEPRLVGRTRVFEQAAESAGFFGMARIADEASADEAIVWRVSGVADLDTIAQEVAKLIAVPLNTTRVQIHCFNGEGNVANLNVGLIDGSVSYVHKVLVGLLTSEPIIISEERRL
ncbi:MAG: hypothetical protein ACFFCO_11060 [Promethearchaeota archaeon]